MEYLINEQIKQSKVRIINEHGDSDGIYITSEAIKIAKRRSLDLVLISQATDIPSAKILDWSKFRYNLQKASKEQQKKNKLNQVETKEIQLRPVTEKHDLETKAKQIFKFLEDNCKVKIVVKFKGREITHTTKGVEVINSLLDMVGPHKVEKPLNIDNKLMSTIITKEKSKE